MLEFLTTLSSVLIDNRQPVRRGFAREPCVTRRERVDCGLGGCRGSHGVQIPTALVVGTYDPRGARYTQRCNTSPPGKVYPELK